MIYIIQKPTPEEQEQMRELDRRMEEAMKRVYGENSEEKQSIKKSCN